LPFAFAYFCRCDKHAIFFGPLVYKFLYIFELLFLGYFILTLICWAPLWTTTFNGDKCTNIYAHIYIHVRGQISLTLGTFVSWPGQNALLFGPLALFFVALVYGLITEPLITGRVSPWVMWFWFTVDSRDEVAKREGSKLEILDYLSALEW